MQRPFHVQNSTNSTEPLTVFIGGLPGNITHKEIHRYFADYAAEISIYLKFKGNGLCAGHGLLKLKDETIYNQILEEEHFINGRQIECRAYYSSSAFQKYKEKFQNCRIFVTKIPTNAENRDLKRVFECIGKVVKAYIIKNEKKKKAYEFGYVVFKNHWDAEKAVELKEFRLKGKTVICKKFNPKDKEKNDFGKKQGRIKRENTLSSGNSTEAKQNLGNKKQRNNFVSDGEFQTIVGGLKRGEKVMTQDQLKVLSQMLPGFGFNAQFQNFGNNGNFLNFNNMNQFNGNFGVNNDCWGVYNNHQSGYDQRRDFGIWNQKAEKFCFKKTCVGSTTIDNLREISLNHLDVGNIRLNNGSRRRC